MNINDVVALARAGYNVQQINAIISMMSQPTQQPAVQQMQQPAVQQMQQPMVQQMQQPAVQQMQQPVVQQMQQPVVQQMQQPAQTVVSSPAFPYGIMMQPAQMQQPAQEDPILAQLKQLTGAIYQGNIANIQQPAQRTPEDIIASIINPEVKKEG